MATTSGPGFDPKNVSGQVHLTAVETGDDGVKCLKIEADTKTSRTHFAVPTTMPSEVVFEDQTASTHYTWRAPIDLNRSIQRTSVESTTDRTWSGMRGKRSFRIDQKIQREMDVRILKE
jgi:hypothetical protein